MIGVKISDGLGNQLFQYSTAYSVAKKNHTGLILDHSILDTNPVRTYELDQFHLDYDKAVGVSQYPTKPLKVAARAVLQKSLFSSYEQVNEKELYAYDESIFDCGNKNVYLNGYWQNYRYFKDYRKELQAMIRPVNALSSYAQNMTETIQRTEHSVSVHIRRGDYVGHGALPSSYFMGAMNRMREQLSDPMFFIFSDDTEYIRALFGTSDQIVIIDNPSGNQSVEDFLLMKACRYHIIGNSTYSWWAAYAAEETHTICPIYQDWTEDFYPTEWERIDVAEETR